MVHLNNNQTIGCFSIITNSRQEILLVKRKDLPLWDLPGGRLEKTETAKDCAIRETYEETKLQICCDYLIATYYITNTNDIQHVFHAKMIGGALAKSTTETSDAKWFSIKNLPINLVPNRKMQIRDFSKHIKNQEFTIRENRIIQLLRKLTKK